MNVISSYTLALVAICIGIGHTTWAQGQKEKEIPTLHEWLKAIDSTNLDQRCNAIARSVFVGEPRETVPVLIRLLRDQSPRVRAYAASALGSLSIEPAIVPALIGSLSDTGTADVGVPSANTTVGRCAAGALGHSTDISRIFRQQMFVERYRNLDPEILRAKIAKQLRPAVNPLLSCAKKGDVDFDLAITALEAVALISPKISE